MSIMDQAIEILAKTNDGDLLTPQDLHLVQITVNRNLSEAGEVAFANLYAAVVNGSYAETKRWFHGIEYLTNDHEGYVYWKGKCVEHFSYQDHQREAEGASRLAEKCRALEANGIAISTRSTTNPDCYTAPADTPWKVALTRYYAFFRKNGQVMGIFYRLNVQSDASKVVGVYKDKDGIHVIPYEGAYEGFHAAQGDGWESLEVSCSYEETDERLSATGLSAEELDKVIIGT
jgi:hypothetical protein